MTVAATGNLVRALPGLRFEFTRVSRGAAAVVVVTALASLILQGHDLAVPLIPGDAIVRTSPLLPLLISVPLVATSTNPMPVLEATAQGRRLILARLCGALIMAVIGGTLAALSASGGDPEGISPGGAGLNALCYLGLGLATATFLGADLAWLTPCLVALCTFFFGKDFDNQVRGWAWLLQEPTRPLSWAVSASLLVLGVALYSRFDSLGLLHRKALR